MPQLLPSFSGPCLRPPGGLLKVTESMWEIGKQRLKKAGDLPRPQHESADEERSVPTPPPACCPPQHGPRAAVLVYGPVSPLHSESLGARPAGPTVPREAPPPLPSRFLCSTCPGPSEVLLLDGSALPIPLIQHLPPYSP